MNLIQTKSFKLAIYSKGDESSSRLALVLPGKLDTKDYPHMPSHVEYLSKKGFYAVSFDPPGTWESPGDIKLYTMTNYAKTVNELIEYFGNKPTFVMGHSFGGGITLLVGVNNPNVISFASIMSRGSYMPEHHGEDYPDQEWKARGYRISTRDLPKNLNQKKEFKLPYSFLEDRINYDISEGLSPFAKNSSHLSTNSQTSFSAKEDKV